MVKTKLNKRFQIHKGVFQVIHCHPLSFCFHFHLNLVALCNCLPICGFSLQLQMQDSPGLPPPDLAIYAFWNEANSNSYRGGVM